MLPVFFILSITGVAWGQAPGFASLPGKAEPAAVTGLYRAIHSTGDLDRGWEFYRSVFGMQMTTESGAAATALRRPAKGAAGLWNLTNTQGSSFRNVFMKLPGVELGHELTEFTGIEQKAIRADLWDPGASVLILNVGNLDAALDLLKKSGGQIVSMEGKPVRVGGTRAVLARDPDGFLLELIESSKPERAIGVTVANLEATRRFYEDLLGFKIHTPARFENKALKLLGLTQGEYRVSSALVPGTSIRMEFYEFRKVTPSAPEPVRYRIQDPGALQLQLRVRGLDDLLEQSKKAGARFVSVDQKPIQAATSSRVFIADPDGNFAELVQPK
jgi:catechol 2,3-dioxygenase-like lactoylglutathione lyase family enzyme